MKRFFLMIATALSFLSTTCYGDFAINFFYSLVVNEELFAQADENKKIINSSDYIHSFDYAIQFLTNTYDRLDDSSKPLAAQLMQSMQKCGLIKSGFNNSYIPAYRSQTTLKVLVYGLMSDQEIRSQITEELHELIITFQSEVAFSVDQPETIDDDVRTMTSLYNCLIQLSFNPLLVNDDDYLNSLYQAFSKAESSISRYICDLMLFNFDLLAADLYTSDFPLLPMIQLTAAFQDASKLQPLMLSLLTDTNQLFFEQMINHLFMGINTMRENGS